MKSRASIAGHPIHPMLVTFPIGLWGFSFVADLIYLVQGGSNPVWASVAYYAMAGGIIGALVAAVFGFIDLLLVTVGQTRRIGIMHMTLNLIVVVLYAINLFVRTGSQGVGKGLVWLSALSILLLVTSGWLGGELVFRYGVGVNRDSIK
jgi:uncharacterized membrane protein